MDANPKFIPQLDFLRFNLKKYNVTMYSLIKNKNKKTSDVNRKVKVFL